MHIFDIVSTKICEKNTYYKAHPDDFEDIYLKIYEENFLEAEELCWASLNKGCLDIRIICYAVFCKWVNTQDSNYQLIFEDLYQVHLALIKVVETDSIKEKVYLSSLSWLYTKLLEHVNFTQSGLYSSKENKSVILESLTLYIDQVHELFQEKHQLIHLLHRLLEGLKKLRLNQQKIMEEDISNVQPLTMEVESKIDSTKNSYLGTIENNNISPSNKWNNLIKDIELFATFVGDGNFFAGAIIQHRIEILLHNFNPKEYFPDIFSTYLNEKLKSSRNISEIIMFNNHHVWKLLEELYEVDIQSFCNQNFENLYELITTNDDHGGLFTNDADDMLD